MILLQILDEGSVTDSQGRKVDFRVIFLSSLSSIANGSTVFNQNTIICLTSNLGSDILADPESCDIDGVVSEKAKQLVMERTSEFFPPELLNRLDSMLVFNKLSRESILQVVSLRLNDVAERLKNRRITIDIDDAAKNLLAQHGYSDVYGARAIARVVRTDVLFPLAQKLLKGTIRDGDVVKIRLSPAGQTLDIQDNHPADSNAAMQSTSPTY